MMKTLRSRNVTLLDRVYEHISLPPVVVRAIDTPQFQRLRGLKQLGVSSYLYPGAVHTRFEHSIGVAHLARTMLLNIQALQPELEISEGDVHNGMLAGLCHDVGHGPFSHLFEDVITAAHRSSDGCVFDHEEMSLQLMRRMLKDVVSDDDMLQVELMMKGDNTKSRYGEIISNKRGGVDVDRIDYFIRDSMCCFGKPTIDVRINRLFNATKLHHDAASNAWRLVFEEKMALTLRDLFGLRAKLHKSVYQHQVVKNVGHMIGDAFRLAEPYLKIHGRSVMECAQDPELFLHLGDWILDAIAASSDPKMAPAQEVLRRLQLRELYPLVFSAVMKPHCKESGKVSSSDLSAMILSEARATSADVSEDELIVDVVRINMGKGVLDPLTNIGFFNPKKQEHVSFWGSELGHERRAVPSSDLFTPTCFEERVVMVFSRRLQMAEAVRVAAERWSNSDAARRILTDGMPYRNAQ